MVDKRDNPAFRVALDTALAFDAAGFDIVVLRTAEGLQVFADGVRQTRNALRRGKRSAAHLAGAAAHSGLDANGLDEWDEEILDGFREDME